MFWVISNPWKTQVYRTETANKKEERKTEKHKDSVEYTYTHVCTHF